MTILLLADAGAYGANALDVCTEPEPESAVRAGYQLYEEDRVNGADLGRDHWALDVLFRRGDDWLMGGAYRGTLIDESEAGFRTNGYLHSFYFVLHRLRTGDRRLRWAVAPALSGSSNVTKDTDEYDGEAWQFNIAAVWEWPANEKLAYRAGLCADHRFGRYRAYPVLGLAYNPHPDWLLEAGFPDTKLTYRPGAVLGAALAIYPNGNEWYVKDQTLTYASMFEYRAWAFDFSLHWRASESIELTFIGGADFDSEYRGQLEDGSRPALDAGTVGRVGIEFSWLF